MEQYVKAYYSIIDSCSEHPQWVRKIEEELGASIAMMFIEFDESVRDEVVEASPYFSRFVKD
jgi:hypothetical protein